MKTERAAASVLLLMALIALTGCGLKGDLYLSGPESEPEANEPGTPGPQAPGIIIDAETGEAAGSDAEDALEKQVE